MMMTTTTTTVTTTTFNYPLLEYNTTLPNTTLILSSFLSASSLQNGNDNQNTRSFGASVFAHF